MNLPCIDTQVLIWGVQGLRAHTGLAAAKLPSPDLPDRARQLFARAEAERTHISIPAVVVGEFLCGVNVRQRPAVLQALGKGFRIDPYDLPAAGRFAELLDARKADGTIDELKERKEPISRSVLKADLMIIATAMSIGADVIYSHDPDILKLAKGLIRVAHLPPREAEQRSLLE